MANTLENTTTFSGSDIQVIAYRGSRSPAEQFELDQVNKDIGLAENEASQLRRNYKLATDRLEREQSDFAQAQAASAREQETLRKSGLGDVAAGRLVEDEGKFQNQKKRITTLNEEIRTFKTGLESVEQELTDLNDRSKDLNGSQVFNLGTIHTVTYSSFREKFAVRTLGRVQAKTYTRGPRTVAGTLVFNVMQEHELFNLTKIGEKTKTPIHPRAVMLDQVNPFNILLIFANEYGAYSALHLLNVDLASEGQEMSVDSILTHNTMNFYATDMLPMQNLGNAFGSYDEMISGIITEVTQFGDGSELISETDRSNVDAKINNPFSNNTNRINELLSTSRGLF